MENTQNYGLRKPSYEEFGDVVDLNYNADVIDAELKALNDNKANSTDLTTLNTTVTEHLAELNPLPPVEAELVRGTQTVTAEHDSNVKVKLFEGDTIVNLVPLFDSGAWTLPAQFTVNSPSKVTMVATAVGQQGTLTVPVTPLKTYRFIMNHIGVFTLRMLDSSLAATRNILVNDPSQAVSFTPTASELYAQIILTNTATGTFTFEDVRIVEGTINLPFVANVKGITNPTIENTTNGTVATLKGTFHEGDIVDLVDNQPIVTRAKREVVLDGSLDWEFHQDNANGTKIIKLKMNNFVQDSQKVVKFNGKILETINVANAVNFNNADQTMLRTSDNYLFIIVADTDSGWGETYVPIADEIKAFILGWRMDTAGQAYPSPYNGTGTKEWVKIDGGGIDVASSTQTLPTVMNDKNWQPHRLIYDLATPITEVVEVVGSLILDKGDNTLEVSEGRIVRERLKPLNTGSSYHINRTDSPYETSKLKQQTEKILSIYKNDKDDTASWAIYRDLTATYGRERASTTVDNFDTTAVYTVDYIPLELYKVTAPTNPITIEYQSNLASVVEQTVDNIAQIQSDVADLQDSVVRKGEGVVSYNPTLLSSWVNYGSSYGNATVSTDSLNYTKISGVIKNGLVNTTSVIFKLSIGSRPKETLMVDVLTYNGSALVVTSLVINKNGDVLLGSSNGGNYWLSLDGIPPFKSV